MSGNREILFTYCNKSIVVRIGVRRFAGLSGWTILGFKALDHRELDIEHVCEALDITSYTLIELVNEEIANPMCVRCETEFVANPGDVCAECSGELPPKYESPNYPGIVRRQAV